MPQQDSATKIFLAKYDTIDKLKRARGSIAILDIIIMITSMRIECRWAAVRKTLRSKTATHRCTVAFANATYLMQEQRIVEHPHSVAAAAQDQPDDKPQQQQPRIRKYETRGPGRGYSGGTQRAALSMLLTKIFKKSREKKLAKRAAQDAKRKAKGKKSKRRSMRYTKNERSAALLEANKEHNRIKVEEPELYKRLVVAGRRATRTYRHGGRAFGRVQIRKTIDKNKTVSHDSWWYTDAGTEKMSNMLVDISDLIFLFYLKG